MNDTTTTANTEDYVNALDKALTAVDPAVRATILEDVRGHIADALDGGQTETVVLNRLGSPDEMALSVLAELGVATPSAAGAMGADSSRSILLLTATAVAVLTAAVLSHILPHRSTTTALGDGVTQTGPAGLALVLLTLVPVIAAVLPLILPTRMRAGFTLAAAIAGTVLSAITLSFIGSLYLPLVFLLWAAVTGPWLRGHANGHGIRRILRIAFTIAIVVPPVIFGTNMIIHTFEVTWVTWAGVLLSLLLVGLFAGGARAGYLMAAALGVGMMIFAVIDFGMLSNDIWLAGGLYLTIGLSAFLANMKRWNGKRTSLA
ncbi:hypothetical protein I6E81_07185 [Salinibacterium sp. NG22]|uniref:HAAS signaling domain-containing protein n=1 Tax=Salinibacterium sp. NG22 TaxID=2792040 RepID=UPI0018CE6587|nr:hypothetical protein [Salinibacterium sp. NG22]MBH0109946.1 hypothetical protein [Salinibacterium sp. NG22]